MSLHYSAISKGTAQISCIPAVDVKDEPCVSPQTPWRLTQAFPRTLSGHSQCPGAAPGPSGTAPSVPGLLPVPLQGYVVYMPEISIVITFVLSRLPEATQPSANAFMALLYPATSSPDPATGLDYCYPGTDSRMCTSCLCVTQSWPVSRIEVMAAFASVHPTARQQDEAPCLGSSIRSLFQVFATV